MTPRKESIKISLKIFLMLVTLTAIFISFAITPRLRRFQSAQRLERDCLTLSHIHFSEPNALDKLLGIDGEVLDIGFWGTKEPTSLNVLTVDCLELLAAIKAIEVLELTNVLVETGTVFPSVSKEIRIHGIEGNSLGFTLNQLLSMQRRLSIFDIERVPDFTDTHVSRLAGIKGLHKITLSSVSVTGQGFETFSVHQYPIDLTLADSLVSTEGLRCIATCKAIQRLSLFLKCDQVDVLAGLQHADSSMEVYIQIPKNCKFGLDMVRLIEGFAEQFASFNLVMI